MADFKPAFGHTIGIEGGYVNDPDDNGGETKFGISKRSYPHLDIKALTIEKAAEIYKLDYWDELRLDQVSNQAIAAELFDSAVNCGVGTASQWLQQSLNLVGGHVLNAVSVDGVVGSKTLVALESCQYPAAILKCLNGFQFERYLLIVRRDITQRKFFRGWLRRVWEQR